MEPVQVLRAWDAGHGLGFAWLALGLAMAPLFAWAPKSGALAAVLACAGLALVAAGRYLARGSAYPEPKPTLPRGPWSRDRALGFLAGTATFWAVFAFAASAGVAAEGNPETSAVTPPLEGAGQVAHTFRIDPSRYVAMGAPSTAVGPAWAIPATTLRVDGVASWDATSGLTRLHVTLEEETPTGWVELGRWVVAPDGTFNATVDAPAGRVRLTASPDASNPAFQPVDVAATVTFLARSA